MHATAAVIVVLAGIWLIALASLAIVKPACAKEFLSAFASSALTHFVEIFLRIMVGASFAIYSPQMKFSIVFSVFGWLLILTSVVLLFVPWKQHKRFAEWSLPMATRQMELLGAASLLGGIMILYSFFSGPAAL